MRNRYLVYLSIFVFVIMSSIPIQYVDMNVNTVIRGHYLLWPIWSLAGIGTINTIGRIIEKISVVSVLLESIGKYSMSYYVSHWPLILLTMSMIHKYLDASGYPLLSLLLIPQMLLIIILLCVTLVRII